MDLFYKPLLSASEVSTITYALDTLEENLQYNDEESEQEREETEESIEKVRKALDIAKRKANGN